MKINEKHKTLTYSHIKKNYKTKKEITKALAENFKKYTSSSNYNPQFQNIYIKKKKK